MILMYHKINDFVIDENTISTSKFYMDMESLKNKRVVYLDDYDPSCSDSVVITFDDAYHDILEHASPILLDFRYKFEIFVVENFLRFAENGKKSFLNLNNLIKLRDIGGRLQYHTKSHIDLTKIKNTSQIINEIKLPSYLKELSNNDFNYLAYPYCTYDQTVIQLTKKYYKGACSGKGQGLTNNFYALDRLKVMQSTSIDFNPQSSHKRHKPQELQ